MVNTFIVTDEISQNAKYLDYRRLGKQRVEAYQIIEALEKIENMLIKLSIDINQIYFKIKNSEILPQTVIDFLKKQSIWEEAGWLSHPVTKMWMGYSNALKAYFNYIVKEWIARGYQNNMKLYDLNENNYHIVKCHFDGVRTVFTQEFDEYSFPPWAGFPPFIMSQRASLYRKDNQHYVCFNDEYLQPYVLKGYFWPCDFYWREYFIQWDANKYLAEIGTGAPPQYRYSKDIVQKWLQNKLINPLTNRKISENGTIYKDLEAASKFYF